MRFDFTDLHLFINVVDAGSITQGAARVHLALASASERLRNMEAKAGLPLLVRHARGVTTTEAGEALAHHARLIGQQQSLLNAQLRDYAHGARGSLHLHANTAALANFLPPRLAPWLAERPRLQLDLQERTSSDIVRSVRSGLVEAGIASDAVQAPDLVMQPVAPDQLVLIVPARHALAGSKRVRLAQLQQEQLVGLSLGSALQDHIDEQARAGGQRLRWRIHMKTFEGLCEMVAHGVGLAIVPHAIASLYRRRLGLRTVRLNEPWAQRQLCLCFQSWTSLSAPMQSLLQHLGGSPEFHSSQPCI